MSGYRAKLLGWRIVGPNEEDTGIHFYDCDEAQRVARFMSQAYEAGKQAALPCSNEPSEASEPASDIENDWYLYG